RCLSDWSSDVCSSDLIGPLLLLLLTSLALSGCRLTNVPETSLTPTPTMGALATAPPTQAAALPPTSAPSPTIGAANTGNPGGSEIGRASWRERVLTPA